MTNNTQFKTLLNTWLNQKKPMITPSTHASFTLIAENHLIPYFGKRKIGSITEADIQSYISYLYNAGRLNYAVKSTFILTFLSSEVWIGKHTGLSFCAVYRAKKP